MAKLTLVLLILIGLTMILASPIPGGHKHVKYRIHVPHKIHTVFVTKVIKVPEHHHHHHEVKKEEHHHHHKKEEHHGYGHHDWH